MLWWNEVLLPRRYSLLSQLEHFGAVPIPDNLGFFDLHASVLGLGSKPFNIVLRNTPRSDVDMPDRMGRTALHLAAQRGDVSMVKELLAKGADPNLEDLRGQVPLLLWANYHPTHNWSSDQSAENCENMLDILGTHKAVNHRDRNGRSVSHHVLYFDSGIVAALEKLKSLGVNFEDKHHPIRPLIIEATVANRESCQVIPWLLENGCDINCRGSPTGQTSIMYAVFHQKYETLDLLLHRGADYALLHKGQRNIVHYAASYSYLRILEILCQHPLERLYLDAKDVHGWTPLDNARWRRDFNYYWSNWAMKEPDEDPVLWYNAFKALYRHIAESQGLDYNWESEEDSEEDSEQDSEQDTEDHSTDSANTEYSLRPAIPGSYPDT
jgi:ankyrin repeat protein